MGGDEGNPKGKPVRDAGSSFQNQETSSRFFKENLSVHIDCALARTWAEDFHEAESKKPDSTLAMFPPEDVLKWAEDWVRRWNALPAVERVGNPLDALGAFLLKVAGMSSKKCRLYATHQDLTDTGFEEPPF